MNILYSLFIGLTAGFLLGFPIGPNGTLCLYKSVKYGWQSGMTTALGCILSLSIHSAAAAFLIGRVSDFGNSGRVQFILKFISAIVLIVIGILFLLITAKNKETTEEKQKKAYLQHFTSAFLISISNPKNILGFSAFIFANPMNIGQVPLTVQEAGLFSLGTFLSCSFTFSLLILISSSRIRSTLEKALPVLKYMVGGLFIFFGAVRLISILI